MLELDGSYGEGGGQVIRSALALAAVTGKEIRFKNIRANRSKPGLAFQHITAVKAVAQLCGGKYSELKVGNSKLEFIPGEIRSGKFKFDIGTAGSITLVLQACILPALFSTQDNEIEITLRGGTDVKWSPPFDYFRLVFLNHLVRMGIEAEIALLTRGYYPQGGGEVHLKVKPGTNYKRINLTERGKLKKITGVIHNRALPSHITHRMLQVARDKFENISQPIIQIDEKPTGPSLGTGIVLVGDFERTVLGASALGSKGIPAEQVGANAASELLTELNGVGTVDIFTADQLIPFIAMFGGELTVRKMSLHAKTNIWLVEQFMEKKFRLDKHDNWVKISL